MTAPPSVVRVRPAPLIDPLFGEDPADPAGRAGPAATGCHGQLPMPGEIWTAPVGGRSPARCPPEHPPASGDAQGAAHRFVEACAEVLNGYRPIAHLRPHTRPVDFAALVDHLTRRAVRVHKAGRTGQARVAVRRVRVCEPRPGIAEVAAVLDHRDGSWAMAVRLERRRDRWTCTSLQVI